jgi:hypothetical protein
MPKTENPALVARGLPVVDPLGEKVSPENSNVRSLTQADFVLAVIPCAHSRVRLIENELALIGTALKGRWITPETAVEWCDEVAPGCLSAVSDSMEVRR